MPLLRRDPRRVTQVIGMAHERIHRAKRVALLPGQSEERVIKILRFGAGHSAAYGVRHGKLLVHASPPFCSNARATSQSLRGFEIAGRDFNTSNPCRSMAFKISCPPRLN